MRRKGKPEVSDIVYPSHRREQDALATASTPGIRLNLGSLRDVSGLRTFLALGDLELYLITFLQALVTFRSNGAVVHKYIGAIVPSDEAVALRIIKPLHRTFQSFHVRPFGHVLLLRGRTRLIEAIVLLPAGSCQAIGGTREAAMDAGSSPFVTG